MRTQLGLLAGVGLIMAGCQIVTPAQVAEQVPEPSDVSPNSTSIAEVAAPLAETPLVVATSSGPDTIELEVWIVESLAPEVEAPGGEELLSQLAAFDQTRPDIQLEVQTKQASGRGSILDYLRTAPPVAPSVLPDLVLISRDDVIQATREGLIVPVQGLIDESDPSTLQGNLYPTVVALGQVDGVLVGLPYIIDIWHAVYRPSLLEQAPRAYTDFVPKLDENQADAETTFAIVPTPSQPQLPLPAYIFPAAASNSMSPTAMMQYLAIAGTGTEEDGRPVVDEAALTEVLTFYQQARETGIISTKVLQYSAASDIWDAFTGSTIGMAEITSSTYLATRVEARDSEPTATLTAQGSPTTLVDGWLWVPVTNDPQHQSAALALIEWLIEPVNQGTYAQAVGYLPTQPAALAVWGSDDPYVPFVNELMESAQIMPGPTIRSTLGMAVQDALEDVLLELATVPEAVSAATIMINSEANR